MKLKPISVATEDEFARLIRRVFLLMYLVVFLALGVMTLIEGSPAGPLLATAGVVAILLGGTYLFFIGAAKRLFNERRAEATRRMRLGATGGSGSMPNDVAARPAGGAKGEATPPRAGG